MSYQKVEGTTTLAHPVYHRAPLDRNLAELLDLIAFELQAHYVPGEPMDPNGCVFCHRPRALWVVPFCHRCWSVAQDLRTWPEWLRFLVAGWQYQHDRDRGHTRTEDLLTDLVQVTVVKPG